MIEDDIDSLIQKMQSKPYDSTRYLDGGNGGAINRFIPQENIRENHLMNFRQLILKQGF
jgi:hypothetical protein